MDADKLESVLDKLRILMRESYAVFDEKQNCCDLTYSQCHTLLEVGTRGQVSLVELAGSLGLDTSTLSRTIQSLVVRGLVTRKADEKDRRYVKIALSAQGKRAYETIGRLYYEFMTEVFARIPARSHGTVLEGVGLFAEAMKKANEARGGASEMPERKAKVPGRARDR